MKFNLDVTIPQVVEQYSHGTVVYKEIEVSAWKGTGDTILNQDESSIILNEDQALELYHHLKQVFGE